jgi:hypothetical protein
VEEDDARARRARRLRRAALLVAGVAACGALVVILLVASTSLRARDAVRGDFDFSPAARPAQPSAPPGREPPPSTSSQTLELPLPVPARDQWHTYVVDLVLGRTDGSTVRPGALRVWADGADRPVIDVSNINTLQRFDGVTQKWMQVWEGDYTRALQRPATQSLVLTRIGGTLAEALSDRPTADATTVPGQFYTGSGADLGPPTAKRIEPRLASSARIPAALGGNTSAADPLPTYEIELTPNYVSPRDGAASNYQSVWIYPSSPTTPWRSPDSQHAQSRYLLVDPRSADSDGRRGRDEFWMIIERRWPSDFDPREHGDWGVLFNLHNVAGDVGWDSASGSGVSAVALDWDSNERAPSFHIEYQDGMVTKESAKGLR